MKKDCLALPVLYKSRKQEYEQHSSNSNITSSSLFLLLSIQLSTPSMAGALVSTLLEQLGSIAFREAEQEIKLVVGVDTEVRKLEGNLRIIRAVLDDAEKRQLKENAVKLWLEKLKDTSYEMDDVLDEWNTALIKSEIEKEEEENAENEPIVKKKKVCPSIPSPSYLFGQVKKLGLRHDISHKIKN